MTTRFKKAKDRLVYNIDLDGTLTYNEPWWSETPKCNPVMKKYVRELVHDGHVVIIWTARGWEHASKTVGWLIANEILFHGIRMDKGGADYYIDDKAINAEDIK